MRTKFSGRLLILTLAVGVAMGLGMVIAYAADGDMDPFFGGGDGLVTTNFHNTSDDARAVAIQDDGKIVVVGTTHITGTNYNFSVARYHPDGSPDKTFSFDGHLTTDIYGNNLYDDGANAVAIQPVDGKIVAAGHYYGVNFAAVRYNPDGSLDTSFGNFVPQNGRGHYHLGYEVALGVAIQPSDGKIVLVGYTYDDPGDPADFAVLRLNTDGTLDTSFSGDGWAITDFFGGVDEARAVVIRHDGKIIVAGNAQVSGSNYDFAVAQYNANGSLDTTFSNDGKATVNFFGADDGAYALAIQPADGKIVLAGANWLDCCGYNFAVARLHADGRPDLTFDIDGIQTINFVDGTAEEVANGLALQADRKIVVAGYAPVGGVNDFALVRLNEDGSLDTSFGNGGRLTHDFGGGVAIAYGVTVQLDGRIVAAGSAYMGEPNSYDFAVARYLSGNFVTIFPHYLPLVCRRC